MKCHVKEKKRCKRKEKFKGKEDEEAHVSIGINPMVFVTYKLVLKVLTNVILLVVIII